MLLPLTPDTHVRTLSEVTSGLEKVFSQFRSAFWLQAEVGGSSERGGHMYGTLVETDKSRQIAKMDFAIWKTDLLGIQKRFTAAGLSLNLAQGIKACLLCRLDYHPVYGLKLTVLDADPRFALGELEQRKRELIATLLAEGADAINKALHVPWLPRRIGLITGRDSAACHDILRTLADSGFGYTVLLADSMMQGEQAPASVTAALACLQQLRPELIVIARGGGNRTELASLDAESIARAIVACDVPVWTAIGHEIDHGVPDVVSNRTFKTPTALAEEIAGRFRHAKEKVAAAVALARREWNHRLDRDASLLADNAVGIRQGTRKLANQSRAELLAVAETLHLLLARRLSSDLRHLSVASQRARGSLRLHVELESAAMRRLQGRLRAGASICVRSTREAARVLRRRIDPRRISALLASARAGAFRSSDQFAARSERVQSSERKRLDALRQRLRLKAVFDQLQVFAARSDDRLRLVQAHDPRNALRRGYAIVHSAGNGIITSSAVLKKDDQVRVEFHDGRISAIVTHKEETHVGTAEL